MCRKRFDALPNDLDLEVPLDFWQVFKTVYEIESNDKIVTVNPHFFVIENGTDRSDISSRWLLYAYAFAPFYKELIKYRDKLKPILENALTTPLSTEERKRLYKLLPGPTWDTDIDAILPGTSTKIRSRIHQSLNNNQLSIENFEKFLSDKSWWGQGKTFERSEYDWIGSSVRTAARVIHANSDRLPQIINVVALDPNIRRILYKLVRSATSEANLLLQPTVTRIQGGRNAIFYGAPGTGKSHTIQQEIPNDNKANTIRTVFHADTQTGDFIGSFKPLLVNGELGYVFQPGPFTNALVQAMNNPNKMHYLVIEEINRAPAAAVFGEVFQLLDRKPDGNSKYQTNPSDPAHEVYLAANIVGWKGEMMLPSNLNILASMNSSDQAVMPLDTAFKRRWRFIYIPVDFTNCTNGKLPLPNEVGVVVEVNWCDFAIGINSILSNLDIPEDRHLGPFFLSEDEIDDPTSAKSALLGKLFMYLWDDVLRHGFRNRIFAADIKTYGQLVSKYKNDKNVFSVALAERFGLLAGYTGGEDNESGQS
jgi:hypothetical protein